MHLSSKKCRLGDFFCGFNRVVHPREFLSLAKARRREGAEKEIPFYFFAPLRLCVKKRIFTFSRPPDEV
jgi:hypothetical protein